MVLYKTHSRVYKILLFTMLIFLCAFIENKASSEIISGSVNKEQVIGNSGVVINGKTGVPVTGAIVSIPAKGAGTVTNEMGVFHLDVPKIKPFILAVKAKGYKPFSLIIDKDSDQKPLKLAITEKSQNELVIDTRLHHLGDNNFSNRSANAADFSIYASGPFYFQKFYVDNLDLSRNILLRIGSIIGIDTREAQNLRQSRVMNSSSSPVKVYFNSQQIGEISINGNNHVFSIPSNLLKTNSYNQLKIKTGLNLNSWDHKDYDDIEFMNIVLEF